MTQFDPTPYIREGFTPEEIEQIQKGIMQADAGKLIPAEEVWKHFDNKRLQYA